MNRIICYKKIIFSCSGNVNVGDSFGNSYIKIVKKY